MKSTIPLTLCESTNIAAYGYDATTATFAIKFKSGPGGSIYHYAGVPAWVYADFCDAPSKGRFFAQNIKDKKNADGEYLYPGTLMKPEEDDDEGDVPTPQPPVPPAPETPQEQKPKIEDPEREAA